MESTGEAAERVSPALVDLNALLRQLEHERKWDRHTDSSMVSYRSLSTNKSRAGARDDDDGDGKSKATIREGDDTCERIRDVFAAMKVASSVAPTRRNKSRVSRWHAAQGALSHSWQFVPITSSSASDVDTQQFPFELVRCKPLGQDDEVEEGDYEDEKAKRSLEKHRLLLDFSPQYIEKTAVMLNNARNQAMHVKVVFGRTLFHLDALCPEVEYTRKFILEAKHSGFIRSSWSNVVDFSSFPVFKALVHDLRAVASAEDSSGPKSRTKERLTVYLKFRHMRQKDLKVIYNFDDDGERQQWTFIQCRLNMGTRYAFDTNVSDHVSFRLRVFEKVDTNAEQFERTKSSLCLSGDDSATPRVTLVEGSPLDHEGAVIEKAWRTREVVVDFRGLRFKIVESVRDSEMQIEARLSVTKLETPLGVKLETLFSRIQAVLARFE